MSASAADTATQNSSSEQSEPSFVELLEQIYQNPKLLFAEESDNSKKMHNLFLDMTLSSIDAWKTGTKGAEEEIKLPKKHTDSPSLIWRMIEAQNSRLLEEAKKVNSQLSMEEDESESPSANESNQEEESEKVSAAESKEESENGEPDALQNVASSDLDLNEEEEENASNEEDSIDMNQVDEGADEAKQVSYKDFFGDEPPDQTTKQIQDIEKGMLEPKPWQLSGEATASERPKDSLADMDFDFDMSANLAPDPLSTDELNNLLKKRIEAMNFDDVVRKRKPTQTPTELYEINAQKPSKSLVEEYAADMQKDNSETDKPALNESQKEAIEMWKDLEHEINRYTEPRYIAKKPKEKVDIAKGIVLDAESHPEPQKAPEEVLAPVGSTRQLKGEAEETHEEKKAERKVQKEKYQKKKDAKDAAKGVLYSQSGKDGSSVQIDKDVERLIKGQLNGVEVFKPGEAITEEKKKAKPQNRNILL